MVKYTVDAEKCLHWLYKEQKGIKCARNETTAAVGLNLCHRLGGYNVHVVTFAVHRYIPRVVYTTMYQNRVVEIYIYYIKPSAAIKMVYIETFTMPFVLVLLLSSDGSLSESAARIINSGRDRKEL